MPGFRGESGYAVVGMWVEGERRHADHWRVSCQDYVRLLHQRRFAEYGFEFGLRLVGSLVGAVVGLRVQWEWRHTDLWLVSFEDRLQLLHKGRVVEYGVEFGQCLMGSLVGPRAES